MYRGVSVSNQDSFTLYFSYFAKHKTLLQIIIEEGGIGVWHIEGTITFTVVQPRQDIKDFLKIILFNTDKVYEFDRYLCTCYLKKFLFISLNKTLLLYFETKHSFAFMW